MTRSQSLSRVYSNRGRQKPGAPAEPQPTEEEDEEPQRPQRVVRMPYLAFLDPDKQKVKL